MADDPKKQIKDAVKATESIRAAKASNGNQAQLAATVKASLQQQGVPQAPTTSPKPKPSAPSAPVSAPTVSSGTRSALLLLLIIVSGAFFMIRMMPEYVESGSMSLGGYVGSAWARFKTGVTDTMENVVDPWGKAQRETTIGTKQVGEVQKREGVSLDIPMGGFPSIPGGSRDQWLSLKVSNTGYLAKDVHVYIGNCDDVNKIVFTPLEDPKKSLNVPGEGDEGFAKNDGDYKKQCYFAVGGWSYNSDKTFKTDILRNLPEPMRFYLGPKRLTDDTDNPTKKDLKSINANVTLKYLLGEGYRALTYDIEKGEMKTSKKEAQAFLTGGPLGVKISATENNVKSEVPIKLYLDLVVDGSDADTTEERLELIEKNMRIHIPTVLAKWDEKPNLDNLNRDEGIDCDEVGMLTTVVRAEEYYNCTLIKKVTISESGAPYTITLNLNPAKELPESIGPIVIDLKEGGYRHTITKNRAITVTKQAE